MSDAPTTLRLTARWPACAVALLVLAELHDLASRTVAVAAAVGPAAPAP